MPFEVNFSHDKIIYLLFKVIYSNLIYKMNKKLKIKKVSRDCATKSKETRIRLWDKTTFWA